MNKININDKAYQIPDRLTVDQWCATMSYDFEDPGFHPQIVAAVTGAPLNLISKAPKKALILAIALIVSKLNERKEVKVRDMNELTFGEFVDLDIWINMGSNLYLKEITETLGSKTQWADEAMYLTEKFAEFRQYTYRQYKLLFNINDIDIEGNDHTQMERLQLARSWYRVIVSLANNDLLNIDQVTEQPLKKVLNFMALQKEKALEEEQKQLEQKRKYDLQRRSR